MKKNFYKTLLWWLSPLIIALLTATLVNAQKLSIEQVEVATGFQVETVSINDPGSSMYGECQVVLGVTKDGWRFLTVIYGSWEHGNWIPVGFSESCMTKKPKAKEELEFTDFGCVGNQIYKSNVMRR